MKSEKMHKMLRYIVLAIMLLAFNFFILNQDILLGIILVVIFTFLLFLSETYGVKYKHIESGLSYTGLLGIICIIMGTMSVIAYILISSVPRSAPVPIGGMVLLTAILFIIGIVLIYYNWRTWKRKSSSRSKKT